MGTVKSAAQCVSTVVGFFAFTIALSRLVVDMGWIDLIRLLAFLSVSNLLLVLFTSLYIHFKLSQLDTWVTDMSPSHSWSLLRHLTRLHSSATHKRRRLRHSSR